MNMQELNQLQSHKKIIVITYYAHCVHRNLLFVIINLYLSNLIAKLSQPFQASETVGTEDRPLEAAQFLELAAKLMVRVKVSSIYISSVVGPDIRQDRLSGRIISISSIQYTLHYTTLQYNTIQYTTIQYNTIQYNTVQDNALRYSTIPYTTIRCNTI